MNVLVICLEETSAQAMLEGILPRLLPDTWSVRYLPFKGKSDLEKNLVRRLRGWLLPDSYFLVMRDQDSSDCLGVKELIRGLCEEAGKPQAVVRIACRELESFYFGDLAAVQSGLGLDGLSCLAKKAKYRNPDALGNPAEELDKITNGAYQKVSGSRAISPYRTVDGNTSHSFNVLIRGIHRIVASVGDKDGALL